MTPARLPAKLGAVNRPAGPTHAVGSDYSETKEPTLQQALQKSLGARERSAAVVACGVDAGNDLGSAGIEEGLQLPRDVVLVADDGNLARLVDAFGVELAAICTARAVACSLSSCTQTGRPTTIRGAGLPAAEAASVMRGTV